MLVQELARDVIALHGLLGPDLAALQALGEERLVQGVAHDVDGEHLVRGRGTGLELGLRLGSELGVGLEFGIAASTIGRNMRFKRM